MILEFSSYMPHRLYYKTFPQINLTVLCASIREFLFSKIKPTLIDILNTLTHFCTVLYGSSILTYNFHGILHYAEDAVRHGPLTANGAFCFESFNSKFCRFIKSRTYPLTEFARRYYETINVSFFCFSPIRVKIKTYVIERNLIEIIGNYDDDFVQCKVYLQAKDVCNSYCNSLLFSIFQFEQNNF